MESSVHQMSKVDQLRRCNRAEIAQLFDVSPQSVDGWIRRGCPVLERGGRGKQWVMDVIAVSEWRFGARAGGGDVDPESLQPAERKQWYEGEHKRRELQVRDRELIPVAELEEAVITANAAVAQTLLSLPDNLERRAGLAPAQAEVIEQAIHEAMNDLADRMATLAPVGA